MPWLEPGEGGHLGPALDLEHADRVGLAQHVVDLGLLRDRGQVDLDAVMRLDEVDAQVEGGEHAQAEEVDLDQADGGAVVLVPLENAPVLHAAPLDGADLDDRPVADDHAAGVDAEMPREALDLLRQVDHRLGDVVVLGVGQAVAVGLLRPGVEGALGMAEGLAHVPDRRLRPVGDDVGHLGRVLPAVALVDVLDGLFPSPVLDVEVDVGRAVALRRQEALEQQLEADGVGVGDAQGVTDGAVGHAAPALAEDVVAPAELDDVPDDQEVAGEAERFDQGQFVLDLFVCGCVARVPAFGASPGELPEPRHLGVAGGNGVVGEVGGDELQVEGAFVAYFCCPLDGAGVTGEPPGLLGAAAEGGGGAGGQPPVELVEGSSGPDRGHGGGERASVGCGVVDVVGGHQLHTDPSGDGGQGVVADGVERVAVVPQLEGDVVPPERLCQAVQLVGGGCWSMLEQGGRDRAFAAPGEHLPVARVVPGKRGQVDLGQCLLAGTHVGVGDGSGQVGVPGGVPGEDDEVAPVRVGGAGLRFPGQIKGQLGPEDGGDVERLRRLGEAHDAVEPVVVGEGEGA